MARMKTIMKLEDLKTITQLTEFLSGTQAVVFSIILDKVTSSGTDDRHQFIICGWKLTPPGKTIKWAIFIHPVN